MSGTITDTFEYDTYGKLIARTGSSDVLFMYNGRDGVVTDANGLIYMRARYYSPDMRRFINADIIAGELSNAITLNRYAYANGNPVSNIDPFGLSAERGTTNYEGYEDLIIKALKNTSHNIDLYYGKDTIDYLGNEGKFTQAIAKLIEQIKSGGNVKDLGKDIKAKIVINPNYNSSGDELMGDILGFVPILGELYSIVDFNSDEKKDISKLWDAVTSAVTEGDTSKLSPFIKSIKNFNTISNFIGAAETLLNWKSKDKIVTEIQVFVQNGAGASYMYHATVDSDLMFKELYAGYTGSVIKEKDSSFQFVLK